MKGLDDYITGKYDPNAPFNRADYECEHCEWEGSNPEWDEEWDEESGAEEIAYCPECGRKIE